MNDNNTATRIALQAMRIEMDAAFATIAQHHHLVSLKTGKCVFDPIAGCFTFKVEGVFPGGVSPEGAVYNQMRAFQRDLPPLGTEFTIRGTAYTVTGMNSTGSKVHMQRKDDGKTYLFKPEAITRIATTVRS